MKNNFNLSIHHLLIPINLIAAVVFMILAYQTSLIADEKAGLRTALTQQNATFEQAQRLQAQLSGLVVGALQLAEQGNKSLLPIVNRLKELNLLPPANSNQNSTNSVAPTNQGTAAPVPAASESRERGPVKP